MASLVSKDKPKPRNYLKARWAVFFDLVGWEWDYKPPRLPHWKPDFHVGFPCRHTECTGGHTLLVQVKPYSSIDSFRAHVSMRHNTGNSIPADASAAFGNNPDVTCWAMEHGSGGGEYSVSKWINSRWDCQRDAMTLWNQAGLLLQSQRDSRKTWYGTYLLSETWRTIRSRVLERDSETCQRCGKAANVVHHKSYDADVLAGDNDAMLISLCFGCHGFIEFDGGRKTSLMEANERLETDPSEDAALQALGAIG